MEKAKVVQVPASWGELIAAWGEAWGLPSLGDELTITLSSRFRTCLGRCTPTSNEIRIAAFLAHATPDLLHEVLCHEAAHAAAFRLHGGRLRPHGREWAQLMRVAGFRPRASIPTDELDNQPSEMGRRRMTSCSRLQRLAFRGSTTPTGTPGTARWRRSRSPSTCWRIHG